MGVPPMSSTAVPAVRTTGKMPVLRKICPFGSLRAGSYGYTANQGLQL